MTAQGTSSKGAFTPALGFNALTPVYDLAIAIFTRERIWRTRLIDAIDPNPNDLILDIGCGTGSLAHFIDQACSSASYLGLDPDEQAVNIAKKRAQQKSIAARFVTGFFDGSETVEGNRPNKIVTSLVLHQTPLPEKRRIIKQAYDLLPVGGVLIIADYGEQKTALMRFLFRWTVQALDGLDDTQPNADGVLPDLLKDTGYTDISQTATVPTPSGSISVLHASKGLQDGGQPA